jgi:hypothetical protein
MDDFLMQFSESEAQTFLAMLECVSDHSGQYNNGVHFHSGDGILHFSVERTNEAVTHRHNKLTGDRIFLEKLVNSGHIRLVTPPTRRVDKTGRRRGGEPNAFYFTEETLERYRQRNTIDDAGVRKAIGRYVFDYYRLHPDEILDFDVEGGPGKQSGSESGAGAGATPARRRPPKRRWPHQ